MSKTIVISAVNLNKGGTLTILQGCLSYLSKLGLDSDYKIIAIVNNRKLADFGNIEYFEFSWPKKMWLNRIFFEYIYSRIISSRLKHVDLWLSLHDTTPYVKANTRAVYCHNPFAFYKSNLRELFFTPKIVLFSWFSKYIYKINQNSNDYIIVQQKWFKDAMIDMFNINKNKLILAPPPPAQIVSLNNKVKIESSIYSFIFASSPNSHKNFECICQASELLNRKGLQTKFKVVITVKGDENAYAAWLYKNWGIKYSNLYFDGFLNKDSLFELYSNSDCLIFPSKVETWGLPISEFALYKKPMLLANLPYAHETAAGAKLVSYFNPESAEELAQKMEDLINGNISILNEQPQIKYEEPLANDWEELFKILLKDDN